MNPVPDFIAKIARDPKFGGAYELFSISRFFRARDLFLNATVAEIKAGTANTNGAYNDTESSDGVGASAQHPFLNKKVDLGNSGGHGRLLYDFYRGNRGRLRQGFQYGYA